MLYWLAAYDVEVVAGRAGIAQLLHRWAALAALARWLACLLGLGVALLVGRAGAAPSFVLVLAALPIGVGPDRRVVAWRRDLPLSDSLAQPRLLAAGVGFPHLVANLRAFERAGIAPRLVLLALSLPVLLSSLLLILPILMLGHTTAPLPGALAGSGRRGTHQSAPAWAADPD